MVYDVKPIQISPELKALQQTGENQVGYLCWVVMMISAQGKRTKVVLFITAHHVFLAEKGNRLRRVMKLADISEVVVRKLLPPDTKDNTPCNWEVFINNTQPHEPGVLCRIRLDRRNTPNTDDPSVLEAVFKKVQPGISFKQLPPTATSCCRPEQLVKGQGYITPREKFDRMKDAHSSQQKSKRGPYIPPQRPQQQQQQQSPPPNDEAPVAPPPPKSVERANPPPSHQEANPASGNQPNGQTGYAQFNNPPPVAPHNHNTNPITISTTPTMVQPTNGYSTQHNPPVQNMYQSQSSPTPQHPSSNSQHPSSNLQYASSSPRFGGSPHGFSPSSPNTASPASSYQPRLSHLSPSSNFATPPRNVNDNFAITVCVRVA
eukprot:TRINITY_DN20633_c0_g1_i1.p1 TRINITY_DN20633_c0_g1~~TRINITY_DN20633_c0_g1_i1.p1  ORF type:complete len:375 (+),score=66.38 TRINITY_DN20633_c0_g1_i1:42-1166(+)